MLLSLDFRVEDILQHHERIWRTTIPTWSWPPRNAYAIEYAWACSQLAKHIQVPHDRAVVMDAGGGSGSMQHFLAERYMECWNVDMVPRHLSDTLKPSKLVVSDLKNTPMIGSDTFDGILSASAIEHNSWDKIVSIARNLLTILKKNGPLVVTVPAFEIAHYYRQGEWPNPTWPECYCFDVNSFRQLFDSVKDLAVVVEPSTLPSVEEYRATWRDMHADMMANNCEESRRPYLSTGFVLVKR